MNPGAVHSGSQQKTRLLKRAAFRHNQSLLRRLKKRLNQTQFCVSGAAVTQVDDKTGSRKRGWRGTGQFDLVHVSPTRRGKTSMKVRC